MNLCSKCGGETVCLACEPNETLLAQRIFDMGAAQGRREEAGRSMKLTREVLDEASNAFDTGFSAFGSHREGVRTALYAVGFDEVEEPEEEP